MDIKGQVDVPVVGSVDKRVLIGIGGVAAVFVGWRWYSSRNAAAYDPAAAAVDPGMEDPGVLPSVSGAVSGSNSYGLPDGSTTTGGGTDSYGFTGTTNTQWTQYAANQLSQAGDTWSYGTVVTALGQFIANKPLTTAQQQIVQSAIAVAGYPPEGSHVVIPGGDTTITVAPKNLRAWDQITTSQIGMQWDAVAGATHYRIYRTDLGSEPVGDSVDTKFAAKGLQANTTYHYAVAAVTASNQIGPKSNTYTAKTKTVSLKAPTGVKVSSVAATAATVSWTKVPGATSYRIYVNGNLRGAADGGLSTNRVTGLSKKTKYQVRVAADTTNQPPGPLSSTVSFTTKSK
jgi:hypothetical protein